MYSIFPFFSNQTNKPHRVLYLCNALVKSRENLYWSGWCSKLMRTCFPWLHPIGHGKKDPAMQQYSQSMRAVLILTKYFCELHFKHCRNVVNMPNSNWIKCQSNKADRQVASHRFYQYTPLNSTVPGIEILYPTAPHHGNL